jgi:hypothetical protein
MSTSKTSWLITGLVLIWAITGSGLAAVNFVQYNNLQVSYENLENQYTELTDGMIFVDIGYSYGNGTTRWVNNTVVPQNTSVWTLTQLTVVSFNFTQYPFGPFVTMLDGLFSNSTHYWTYYVNGEWALMGADQYEVLTGDAVLWVFTS